MISENVTFQTQFKNSLLHGKAMRQLLTYSTFYISNHSIFENTIIPSSNFENRDHIMNINTHGRVYFWISFQS